MNKKIFINKRLPLFILLISSLGFAFTDDEIVNSCRNKVTKAKNSIDAALSGCPNEKDDSNCREALNNLSDKLIRGSNDIVASGNVCLETKSTHLRALVDDGRAAKDEFSLLSSTEGTLMNPSNISVKNICDKMKVRSSGMLRLISNFKEECRGKKDLSVISVNNIKVKKDDAKNACDKRKEYTEACKSKLNTLYSDTDSSFIKCKSANDKYSANLIAVDTNLAEIQRVSTTTNTCSDQVTAGSSVTRDPASALLLSPEPLVIPRVGMAPLDTFDRLSQFFASHPEYFFKP